MWKTKIRQALNIPMGSALGVFIGYGLYSYWDYKTHPDFYAIQSAPWYTSALVYGIFASAVVLLCLLLKGILGRKD